MGAHGVASASASTITIGESQRRSIHPSGSDIVHDSQGLTTVCTDSPTSPKPSGRIKTEPGASHSPKPSPRETTGIFKDSKIQNGLGSYRKVSVLTLPSLFMALGADPCFAMEILMAASNQGASTTFMLPEFVRYGRTN